jgi:hypothetical protein
MQERLRPSQAPPQGATPAPVHCVRPPTGWPAGAGSQVPVEFAQLSHWPVHGVEQQVLSMQLPLAHCVPAAQVWPLASLHWRFVVVVVSQA